MVNSSLGTKACAPRGELMKANLGHHVDPFFGAHRLWLAHYNPYPTVRQSWNKYWLWQYTDNTGGLKPNSVPGVPGDDQGNLDCDAFDGTREELKAQWAT